MRQWKEMMRLVADLRRLPRVTIAMSGGPESERLYRAFTKRHPRYWVIRSKTWGVGLLKLPADFADYLRGREMQAVRTNRSRAISSGFRFARVKASDYFEDVLAVNRSLVERQGRGMDSAYLDPETVRGYCERTADLYAVLDAAGRIRGYAQVIVAGEVALVNRILGHGADLDKGVMYLCVTEIVREMCEIRRASGSPRWLMYDTFFGAEPGLRYFKERLGFRPYHVRWRWEKGHAASPGVALGET